jgi:hypothetical protein
MLPPLCRARRSTPSPRIRGGTSADRPAAPPAHGAPIPAATHFRSALARAANGQQTSEMGFPQPCEIEPREAQKAASTERSRVHRRHPSQRSKRPVTPEVAGSSPVAPVSYLQRFRVAVVEELGAAADPTPVGVLGVRRKVCQRVLFPASLFQFFSRLTDARRTCRRLHE